MRKTNNKPIEIEEFFGVEPLKIMVPRFKFISNHLNSLAK